MTKVATANTSTIGTNTALIRSRHLLDRGFLSLGLFYKVYYVRKYGILRGRSHLRLDRPLRKQTATN